MWEETASEDSLAIQCLTGDECPIGPTGGMTLVEPDADDLKMRDKLAEEVILARWAERCGEECAATWNKTVGPIVGLTAKAPAN